MSTDSLLTPGDHIRVSRAAYFHHGIYIGQGLVVHFTARHGEPVKRDAIIRCDPVERFAHGDAIEIVAYGQASPVEEVFQRAQSRIGQDGYRLFSNNCEHFARWCKTGQHESPQVANAMAGATGVAGTAGLSAGAVGVVSAAGVTAGLSGAGIMSGLAAVGGTAVGGLGALAVAPIAATTLAMNVALKDDPYLPESERRARRDGRRGTLVGAAAGSAGALATVSAAGSVAGLSAAGMTSGLAAIGGALGGGMATGVAITIAAPAVAAAGVGYGVYRLTKWLRNR